MLQTGRQAEAAQCFEKASQAGHELAARCLETMREGQVVAGTQPALNSTCDVDVSAEFRALKQAFRGALVV